MEKDLFDWNGWDGDQEYMQFYECTLKRTIGSFQSGDKIPCICISFLTGELIFYDEHGAEHAKFQLHYRIGEQLKG